MKGRYQRTTLILFGVVAVVLVLGALVRPREPVYQGRRLSEWLQQLDRVPYINALIANLNNPRPLVRRATAEALGRHSGIARPAVPGLVQALGDPEKDVREAAASALKLIDPKAAANVGVK